MASARINRTSFTNGSYPLRVDYDCIGNSGAMWFDGIMLIDLTEAFGLGFEPTKAWCDENIPYFTGEKVISIDYRLHRRHQRPCRRRNVAAVAYPRENRRYAGEGLQT